MSLWYRVFGSNDVQPSPAALLEHLSGRGFVVTGQFGGDEAGWFRAELAGADGAPLHLERYLSSEEGIRAELNSWAAWLETREDNPNHVRLMERMIQTRQLFTLEQPGAALPDCLGVEVCRYLAGLTEGVFQVDSEGFFAADGTPLLQES